jgi:phosphoribosylcarboxyaminoimidazole (NCAIR) mutase
MESIRRFATVSYVWQSVRVNILHHVSADGLTPSSTPWQRGIPVATANGPTVAINNGTIAGLFAVRILAVVYLENSE